MTVVDTFRTGPCAPWCTASQVMAQPGAANLTAGVAADKAAVASELLYLLSGQQFTGACGPVKIRPFARPVDQDTRAATRFTPAGYNSSWGYCSAWGMPTAGAISHYGCSRPPEIELGVYPVTSITQVLIDGIAIPPNEYQIQDRRTLVRMRTAASATPTDRWGWPTCQIMDLPDTQPGTFSVTYKYGSPPPQAGVDAAAYLAAQLALAQTTKTANISQLPQRMRSLSREGVSVQIVDAEDFLINGRTGMYIVDLFLVTVNPKAQRVQPVVWSPDIGRPRRMPQT